MKTLWQTCLMILTGCILSSCATRRSTNDISILIREKVPIEIRGSEPTTVTLHTRSPGGVAPVSIHCSPETWNSLTGGKGDFQIQLVSSRWKRVTIRRESGHGGQGYYCLFSLLDNYQDFTKVKVQITFPKAPPGITHAEIVTFWNPTDSL
jgi:hypothetical protein